MLRFWNTPSTDNFLCNTTESLCSIISNYKGLAPSTEVMAKEPKREWMFRVQVSTLAGESVRVVGNCDELGNWLNSKSLPLTLEQGSSEGSDTWSATCSIPADRDMEFRYYVCVEIDPIVDSRIQTKHVIVRRSETNVTPRIVRKEAGSNINSPVEVDTFGCYDNFTKVERGWLTTETVIQLKLTNNPIVLWSKKYNRKKIHVKVTPVNLCRRTSLPTEPLQMFDANDHHLDESMDTADNTSEAPNKDWPIVEIAVMNGDEHEYKEQAQFGRAYNTNDFMAFKIHVLDPETVAYLIDYYVYGPSTYHEDPPYHCGFSYVLPSILKSSAGQTIVPVTSVKHRPIGQLTIEYLVIRPIQDFECDMSVSYARVWRPTWLGLDVGHRGAGNSFKECAIQGHANTIRENTIASLKKAASYGADFVEFDVQLSKDLVPVLYHDFHVCMAIKRKNQVAESDMLEMAVKDLTLQQLHLLKIYHKVEGKDKSQRFFDEDLEDHQPFPTLVTAFEALDPHVGFNIEIKWTMELKDGTFELNHPFDLNMYLDTILRVVLRHSGARKIIFSCFHPDICTMIRMKQNKYPVIFLTQGVTSKYDQYNDPRTQSIDIGVHFALAEGLLGLNVHTEDLLRDPTQVKLVTDAGLVLFSWGDDNNDPATIRYLKQLGLHAIIYDKIDEYSSKEVKESIFLVEARESAISLLKQQEDLTAKSVPLPSISDAYVLEVEKMRAALRPSVSTSSSLATLCKFGESELQEATAKMEEQNKTAL